MVVLASVGNTLTVRIGSGCCWARCSGGWSIALSIEFQAKVSLGGVCSVITAFTIPFHTCVL